MVVLAERDGQLAVEVGEDDPQDEVFRPNLGADLGMIARVAKHSADVFVNLVCILEEHCPQLLPGGNRYGSSIWRGTGDCYGTVAKMRTASLVAVTNDAGD
ncbi:hypothetical protein MFM001_01360 [Mycobacterium sp. MFM001]|nr:hypothetical protein MFM001_01360 [Mycobacterium sp. MFM001]